MFTKKHEELHSIFAKENTKKLMDTTDTNPDEHIRCKFEMGQLDFSQGIIDIIDPNNETETFTIPPDLHGIIVSYLQGDWGIFPGAAAANETALLENDTIIGTYLWRDHEIFIITDPDRTSTTVMLIEER